MSFIDATIGGVSGKLEKLKILHETTKKSTFDATIEALFNPAQLRYKFRAEWRPEATVTQAVAGGYQNMVFQSTPPSTLAIDLFFDTYEGAPKDISGGFLDGLRSSLVPDNPFVAGDVNAVDVTKYTAAVANLAQVQKELHRPPLCKLQWGTAELFTGVLTELNQDFTFFMRDGTPVRATLSCTFTAYRTFVAAAKDAELNSADVLKRRVVRRGDTLAAIANEMYDDPARWRDIARENGIDNPRVLAPGMILVIPKVEG